MIHQPKHTRIVRAVRAALLAGAWILLVLAEQADAQLAPDRPAFAQELEMAIPSTSIPSRVSFPMSWQFPGMPSGCVALGTGDTILLERLDPENALRISMQTAPAILSGDIPVASHPAVCDLNAWVFRTFTEERGDSGQASVNFDFGCASQASDQLYWLAESGGSLPSGLEAFDWFTFPAYSVPVTGAPGTVASVEGIVAEVQSVRWIVRREQRPSNPPDVLRAQRARGRIDFTYTAPQGLLPKTGEPRLKSLSFEATVPAPAPPPDYCSNLSVPSSYGNAVAIYTVEYYPDSTTVATMTRTHDFSSFGSTQSEELWEFLDWRRYHERGFEFDMDSDGYLYLDFTPDSGPEVRIYIAQFRSQFIPAETCSIVVPLATSMNGFDVDPVTQQIVFIHGDTSLATMNPVEGDATYEVPCIAYCQNEWVASTATGVIAASATTFKGRWLPDVSANGTSLDYDPTEHNPNYGVPANRFERGGDGKWRPSRSFVYRSRIRDGVLNRVYDNAGVFIDPMGNQTNAFVQFNWAEENAQAMQWLNTTTVTKYAPSGEPIEERDALGIPSAAVLAYRELVPVAVAKNAEHRAVNFESFEEIDETVDTRITALRAHSGRKSFTLPSSGYSTVLRFTKSQQARDKGFLVKLWVKQTYVGAPGGRPFDLRVAGNVINTLAPSNASTEQPGVLHHVAQTGEWSLYSVHIAPGVIALSDTGKLDSVELTLQLPSETVWIDDVRVQPTESQMACYTYDPRNLRLVAQFDDQHFGRFYRYNGEGKLIRTIIETERGVKTVAESYYHTPASPRIVEDLGAGSVASGFEDAQLAARRWPITSDDLRIRRLAAQAPMQTGQQALAEQFELIGLNFDASGISASMLGGESIDVRKIDSVFSAVWARVKAIDPDSLESFLPGMPAGDRHEAIERLLEYDRELEVAEAHLSDAELGIKERTATAEKLIDLRHERAEFLRNELELDRDETARLYEQLQMETSDDDNKTTAP